MGKIILCPYKVCWVFFVPKRLKATKGDASALGCSRSIDKSVLYRHFKDKEEAEDYVSWNRSSYGLSKPYRIYVITDKQFSMMPSVDKEGLFKVLTKTQIKNGKEMKS